MAVIYALRRWSPAIAALRDSRPCWPSRLVDGGSRGGLRKPRSSPDSSRRRPRCGFPGRIRSSGCSTRCTSRRSCRRVPRTSSIRTIWCSPCRVGDDSAAYPIRQMAYHHLVNDRIGAHAGGRHLLNAVPHRPGLGLGSRWAGVELSSSRHQQPELRDAGRANRHVVAAGVGRGDPRAAEGAPVDAGPIRPPHLRGVARGSAERASAGAGRWCRRGESICARRLGRAHADDSRAAFGGERHAPAGARIGCRHRGRWRFSCVSPGRAEASRGGARYPRPDAARHRARSRRPFDARVRSNGRWTGAGTGGESSRGAVPPGRSREPGQNGISQASRSAAR